MPSGLDPDGTKIDQRMTRAMNRRLVLNLIRRERGLSRLQIAKRVNLSPAVVGFVVSDLLSEGYVREEDPQVGGSGRRPVPLAINDGGHHAIGLKLSAGQLDCLITDLAVRQVARKSVALSQTSPAAVVAAAETTITGMLRDLGDARRPLVGAGFSIPARLDVTSGTCISSMRFGWRDVPISQMLGDALDIAVTIEDDTLAYGLAHHLFGLGRNHRTFLALAVGEGIGCAAIMNNNVQRGALGNAGKIGHVLFDDTGLSPAGVCECGRRGCLQTFFSFSAMAERWQRDGDGTDLVSAVGGGNEPAVDLVARAGRAIGRQLAQAVTMTDPERIVLGGEAVALGAAFVGPMQAELTRCYYRDTAPQIVSDESSFYWTAGAAAVALQRIFDFESGDEVTTR